MCFIGTTYSYTDRQMKIIQNGPGNGSFRQCFSLSNEQTIIFQVEAYDEEDFLSFRAGLLRFLRHRCLATFACSFLG